MIDGVANIWMPVKDIERAKEFYQNTLGLPVVKEDGRWVEFATNSLRIALNGREPQGAGADGGPVLTFQPESGLDETVRRLKERGVDFPADVSEHDWGRVATFQDPEGNELQLYEPPRA